MHSLYHVIIDTCFMYYFNCLCNQYFTGSPLRKSYHWQIWWTKAMQSRLFITAWSVYNGRTLLPLIRGFVCKKNLNVIKECIFYFLKIQDILLFCIFEEIVKSVHINPSLPPPPFFWAIELGTWVEVVPLLQVRPTLKPLDFDKTIMMTYWIKIQLIVRFKYIQETLRNDLIAAQELFCYKGH